MPRLLDPVDTTEELLLAAVEIVWVLWRPLLLLLECKRVVFGSNYGVGVGGF